VQDNTFELFWVGI